MEASDMVAESMIICLALERPVICPNMGFLEQLQLYERLLAASPSSYLSEGGFDAQAYKQSMIEAYEKQQRDNAELLAKVKASSEQYTLLERVCRCLQRSPSEKHYLGTHNLKDFRGTLFTAV